MSMTREGFEKAKARQLVLNDRVNKLFEELKLPLKDKVQMNHYGKSYLFGKSIGEETTDDELENIIESTPEKSWNGHINFFGEWIDNP